MQKPKKKLISAQLHDAQLKAKGFDEIYHKLVTVRRWGTATKLKFAEEVDRLVADIYYQLKDK